MELVGDIFERVIFVFFDLWFSKERKFSIEGWGRVVFYWGRWVGRFESGGR